MRAQQVGQRGRDPRSGRQGAAVDLALGSDFRDVTPSQGAQDALKALTRGSSSGGAVPGTEPSALSALRNVDCSA